MFNMHDVAALGPSDSLRAPHSEMPYQDSQAVGPFPPELALQYKKGTFPLRKNMCCPSPPAKHKAALPRLLQSFCATPLQLTDRQDSEQPAFTVSIHPY